MIATMFLAIGISGTALTAAAVLSGNPTRQFVLTRSQAGYELRQARHELAGAGVYISQLQGNLATRTRERDTAWDDRDLQIAHRKNAERRIKEIEELLVTFESVCTENTALRAALQNATCQSQPAGWPGLEDTGDIPLPDAYDDFINATATEWRAGGA